MNAYERYLGFVEKTKKENEKEIDKITEAMVKAKKEGKNPLFAAVAASNVLNRAAGLYNEIIPEHVLLAEAVADILKEDFKNGELNLTEDQERRIDERFREKMDGEIESRINQRKRIERALIKYEENKRCGNLSAKEYLMKVWG